MTVISLPWFVPRGMLLSDIPATRNMATPKMESKARPVLRISIGRPRSQIYATLAPGFAGAIRHRNVRTIHVKPIPYRDMRCRYHGLSPRAFSSRISQRLGIWQHRRWRAELDPFCGALLDGPAPRYTPLRRLASRVRSGIATSTWNVPLILQE